MKTLEYIFTTIIVIIMTLSSTSCENKWPKNGDFDGMWQLISIERDGVVTSLKNDKCYWSVRYNLIQYSTYHDTTTKVFCHFERNDDKLILTDFCHESVNEQSSDNDEWIGYDERESIYQWGIYAVPDSQHADRVTQTFIIDYLDSETMILSTTDYRLEFRKF